MMAEALRMIGAGDGRTDMREAGEAASPQGQDGITLHVNPEEAGVVIPLLKGMGGSGAYNPTTGGLNFYDGDTGDGSGNGSVGEGDTGTGSGTSNDTGTVDDGYSGLDTSSAVNPNATDPNVETMQDVHGNQNALGGRSNGQTEEEQTTSQQGGKAGGGVTSEEAGRANAEYESLYGPEDAFGNPYTGADAINNAYSAYASDFNTSGAVAAFLGTLFDSLRGAAQGSSFGPIGATLGSVYGGLTGRSGDDWGAAARGAMADALATGNWGITTGAPGADSGNGQDDMYFTLSPEGAPVTSNSRGGTSRSSYVPPWAGHSDLTEGRLSGAQLGKALGAWGQGGGQGPGKLSSGLLRKKRNGDDDSTFSEMS